MEEQAEARHKEEEGDGRNSVDNKVHFFPDPVSSFVFFT